MTVEKYKNMSAADYEAMKTLANAYLRNARVQFDVMLYHHYHENARAIPFWLDRVVSTPNTKENKPYKAKAYYLLGEHHCWLAKKFSGLNDRTDNFFLTAVEWFTKAIREGEEIEVAKAAAMYGACYYLGGHGIAKNYRKAVNALGTAAGKFKKLGQQEPHADAIYKIACCFFEGGYGIQQDKPRALEYFKVAAELQHPQALKFLGS